jgi:MFS family permease
MTKGKARFALGVLFAINLLNFYDRLILGAVREPLRKEWQLSDTELSLLGTTFLLLYASVGIPLGRWADRGNRSRILTLGVTAWSILTSLSGFAKNFWQMAALRLTVGVGEATCAPAANSLIGDLFPAASRARAMSIFMLGLPIGNAACLFFSGMLAKAYGWPAAFYVAIVPGLLCAVGAAMIHEPQRGATEAHGVGSRRRAGSPYALVLSIPTMRWLICAGALHNFIMYAVGGFLATYVIRYHSQDVQSAGWVSMAVYGLAGVPGMILGGVFGDMIYRRRRNGRLLLAAFAMLLSGPAFYFALTQPQGHWVVFALLFGFSCMMLYTYYATVYSAIQDVIEPSLRATAMALYFCAMYAFGGAAGDPTIGFLSDRYAHAAAVAEGVSFDGLDAAERQQALEPFRAQGLNRAMYALPIVSLLLAGSLFAGARTIAADMEKLQHWMREQTTPDQPDRQPEKVAT